MQLNEGDLERIRTSNPAGYEVLVEKLRARRDSRRTPPWVEDMFAPQRAFYDDESRFSAALCSRRAGKTWAVAAKLLKAALKHPGSLSVYIALSRASARNILIRQLHEMNNRYDMGLKFSEKDSQLLVHLPNGSTIWAVGVGDSVEGEKLRGLKLAAAVIDEAGSFADYIRALVFDILQPALIDLMGTLTIIGTPAPVPQGLFYEITTGDGAGPDVARKWTTHHWTIFDNVYIPHAEEEVEALRLQMGWDLDHPRYRREYLGEWVMDAGSLVYPYEQSKNSFYQLPSGPARWSYALGIDVGFNDDMAFVVGAYRRNHPEIHIVEAMKRQGLIPSRTAALVDSYRERYGISKVIIDSGGLGKGYAEEMKQRYHIPCEPAEKTKKRAFIEIVRGELMAGVIKMHPQRCDCLISEMSQLVWDERMEMPAEECEDHACDAFLYLVRALLPIYRPKLNEFPMTQAEIDQKQMDEHRANALRTVRARMRMKVRNNDVMRDIANPVPIW